MKKLMNARKTKAAVAGFVALVCLGCAQGTKDAPQGTSTPKASPISVATSLPAATASPAATTSSTEDGKWVDTEISSMLVVSAPGELIATDTGDNTVVYSTSGEKYAVIVTVGGQMDEEPADALEMLKGMVLEKTGAEETHSENTTFEGKPAMRFGLKAKDETGKEMTVEMMTTFIDGSTLVQAAVTEGNHERFFESFELLDADGAEEEVVEEASEES
jgi:hypothetical protein